MRQALEFPETRLDLFVVESTQAVKAERFHGKGGHDTSEDNRLAERRLGKIAGGREVAHEPSRKRVARPGRIPHLLQRKGRGPERLLLVEQQHTVFTPFDDEVLRPFRQDVPGHLDQIRLTAERSGFAYKTDAQPDEPEAPAQG